MKPLFLDCPPRYTRASNQLDDPVAYACSISHRRPTGYGPAWWVAMALICFATVGVML
jgi:hypothetical protein